MTWLISRRVTWILILLSLLAAAILRLPELTTIPPGVHYDEAANGILAAEIGLQGERPIFITSYTGKEVLFFYLAGALARLVGPGIFTLRLTAAFIGLLTVAATYWSGRELLADRRLALVATALVAVSFWHLMFSRLGFRAVSQPLLQALTVAALLRGLRRSDARWMAVGGLFLGLTAYTYLAARLFPLPLAMALLPWLFVRRPRAEETHRHPAWGLVATVVIGGLVLAPLLIFFIRQPELFWIRIQQVAPSDADAPGLLESYARALGMLFVTGDPYWRFNLPGRPLFTPVWGALLVTGWLVMLVRLIRSGRLGRQPRQQTASLLLLLVPVIMLLPTALATNEILPSNLRAIGLIPFIFYLPAVGLGVAIHGLQQLLRLLLFLIGMLWPNGTQRESWPAQARQLHPYTLSVAAGLILIVGGILTFQNYFVGWATRSDLFYETDADLAAVATFLDQRPPGDEQVYVAARHYRHPTLAFLSDRYEAIRWLPDAEALVVPAEQPALIVYPHSRPAPDWTQPYLEPAGPISGPLGPDDQPTFLAYQLRQPVRELLNLIGANFGNVISLEGFELAPLAADRTVAVTLSWRVLTTPAGPYIPFIHLEDQWGARWSQVETFAYPAEQWVPGDLILQRVDVPVPAGTPPGSYRLRLGLFDPGNGERLPRFDEQGRYNGNSLMLADIHLPSAASLPEKLPQPPFALDTAVLPQLQLLGYERSLETIGAGEPLSLRAWWLASGPLPPLVTRLELVRSNRTGVILANVQPVRDTYPFASWTTPQFLIDPITVALPADLAADEYRLLLRVLDSSSRTLSESDLGPLTVTASERLFTVPSLSHPLTATLGDEIALRGYELTETGPNELQLTLAWQALGGPTADYTVFVHVLNSDGSCCLWQQDVMPQQGSYPTSRWVRDEVVVDHYTIHLPEALSAGDYPLELGLYIAETGQRLRVDMRGNGPEDAIILQPPQLRRP